MKCFLLIIFFFTSLFSFGQITDTLIEKWNASYTTPGGLDVANVAFSSKREIYVLGTVSTGSGSEIELLKYDDNGNLSWKRTYSSLSTYANSESVAVKVRVDRDDNVFILINVNPDKYNDFNVPNGYVIRKYNSSGFLLKDMDYVNDASIKLGQVAYDMVAHRIDLQDEDTPEHLYIASRGVIQGGGDEIRLTRCDNDFGSITSVNYDSETTFDDIPEKIQASLTGPYIYVYLRHGSDLTRLRYSSSFGPSYSVSPTSTTIGADIDEIMYANTQTNLSYLLKLENGEYTYKKGTLIININNQYTINSVYSYMSNIFFTGSKTVDGIEKMVLLVYDGSGTLIKETILNSNHGSANSSGTKVYRRSETPYEVYVMGTVVVNGIQYPGIVTFDKITYEQKDIIYASSSPGSIVINAASETKQNNILIGKNSDTTKIHHFCDRITLDLGEERKGYIGEGVNLVGDLNLTYEWSTGDTVRLITVSEPGDYSLTQYTELGCPSTDEVNVRFVPRPGEPVFLHPEIINSDPDYLWATLKIKWANDDPGVVKHKLLFNERWIPEGYYNVKYLGPNTFFDYELHDRSILMVQSIDTSEELSFNSYQLFLRGCQTYDIPAIQTFLDGLNIFGPLSFPAAGGKGNFGIGYPQDSVIKDSYYEWTVPAGWEIIRYTGPYIRVSVPPNANSGEVTLRVINPCTGEATTPISKYVSVIKDQTISFPEPAVTQVGATPFNLGATASSGLDVTYTTNTVGIIDITNGIVTPIGAGTITIKANQAGNSEWNPAPEVEHILTVNKGDDLITFNTLSDVTWNAANFDLDDLAFSKSGRQITWSGSDNTIALVNSNGEVDPIKPGTITITGSLGGSTDWNAAPDVHQVLTVTKINQTITIDPITDKSTTDTPFNVTAVASSGFPLTYEIVSGPATISGNTITLTGGSGNVVVKAEQAGDEYYNAASNTTSFNVVDLSKENQTITFDPLADKLTTDAPFSIIATSTSELAVSFTVSGPATISGSTITLNGTAGTVTVTAKQVGDATYNPAPEITQSFNVNHADQNITLDAIADKITTDDPFDVVATSSSGLAVSYTISGPATINGSTITLNGTAGTVTVTAKQVGDDTFNPAPEITQSFNVNRADQTITLDAIANKIITDDPFDVVATSSSGLAVLFTISGPATINGSTITLTGTTGTVTVTANQAGDATYNPAPEMSTSFEVHTELCAGFAASATVLNDISCNGETNGSFEVDVSEGVAPYTYTLNGDSQNTGSFENLAEGNHIVTITDDNGCTATASATIDEPDAITVIADIVNSNDAAGNGSITITANGGTGILSYSWSNGESTANISDLKQGEYTLTITDENNCTYTEVFKIEGMASIKNVVSQEMKVYPNPTSGIVNVELEELGNTTNQIIIQNTIGKHVMLIPLTNKNTSFDISHLEKGVYFVNIKSGAKTKVLRIVLQ